MKELKLYVCEHCGTQYKDKEKAKICEKTHQFTEVISDERYHENCSYPDKVEIEFSDGKRIWYKR